MADQSAPGAPPANQQPPPASSLVQRLRDKVMGHLTSTVVVVVAAAVTSSGIWFKDQLVEMTRNALGIDDVESSLRNIEEHLREMALTASTTVDTVYVFKQEFSFPRPSRRISQQIKDALAQCAFHEVDRSSNADRAEYINRLERTATMRESFRFRADVGTRAELQYDMNCYSNSGRRYEPPNPLDLEIHVNGERLTRHEHDWSRRARRPIGALDGATESAGTGTFRVHQLTVFLRRQSQRCPSHLQNIVNGDLSGCTFDALIHVSDSLPTFETGESETEVGVAPTAQAERT